MRPIKFRAWDRERKEMYHPVHEAYKDNLWELLVDFDGDLAAWTIENGKPSLLHQSRFEDRYELMQFTGLLDKNSKEIYEGDILRQVYNGHEIIAPMIWNTKKAQFGLDATVDFASDEHIEISIPSNEAPEVIGNIYENPELLR